MKVNFSRLNNGLEINKKQEGCMKNKLKRKMLLHKIEPHDLDLINEALKILPEDCDSSPYLYTKAEILDQLGEP